MATQVEILLRTEGGPAAASAAGGAPSSDNKEKAKEGKNADNRSKAEQNAFGKLEKQFNNKLGGAKKFFSKNLGIQFGLSSILKQSQVFTSFIGTIFQLVGALVDVILAPLLPLFFPLIRMLAAQIPVAQKFGTWLGAKLLEWFQDLKNWYDGIKPMIDEKIEEFKAAWGQGWTEVAKLIWDWTFQGLKWIWGLIRNNALPWIKDKLIEVRDWAWEKFQNLGVQAKAWVITALAYGWRLIYNNAAKLWKELPKILVGVGKFALRFLGWLIKAPFKIFGFGLKIAGVLLKMLLPGIGHLLVGVGKLGSYIVKGLFKGAVGLIKILWKGLFAAGKWMLKGAVNSGKSLIKQVIEKLSVKLGKLPIVGGIFKGLGKATGFLKIAAKASKAIPVLGAVATVGFGAVEAVQVYKKYGLKAASLSVAKTAAAATLAATGNTVASLALDVGGGLAIEALAKKGAFGKGGAHFQPGGAGYTGPAITVNNTIVTQDGTTIQENTVQGQVGSEEVKSDLSANLQAASGNVS